LPKRSTARKLLTLVFALMITFSYYQVGVPAGASAPVEVLSLSSTGSGKSGWSTNSSHAGLWAIRLTAPGQATWNPTLGEGEGVNEGRISITLAPGTTLGDLETLSWWVNTTSGYPPHADILLDLDDDGVFDGGRKDAVTGGPLSGEDDILVAEFAYQPYLGPGFEYVDQPGVPYGHYDPALQPSYYDPTYDEWVETFQQFTGESNTDVLDNNTACWLYSGLPGPYEGGFFGTLKDFKEGSVQSIVDGVPADVSASTVVLEIQIEVDNWLGAAEAYVDDLALNGEPIALELRPPKIRVVNPKAKNYPPGDVPVEVSASDLFGVDLIWYNVKDDDDDWVYPENRTYTSATHLTGLAPGEYAFQVWANNTLGLTGSKTVRFTVVLSDLSVEIHPQTLNLKSNGRWVTVRITPPAGYAPQDVIVETVKLHIGDDELEAEWGKAGDYYVMAKFSRSDLQDLLEPGESVELRVTGELDDGNDFESTGTIRVIYPPPGKPIPSWTRTKAFGAGNGKKNGLNKNHRWKNQGNGKSKGNKGGKGKGRP
jgi:hypothetical protein